MVARCDGLAYFDHAMEGLVGVTPNSDADLGSGVAEYGDLWGLRWCGVREGTPVAARGKEVLRRD